MAPPPDARAQIILLNGASSAGKTTLAQELVRRLEGFDYVGVDDVVGRHPDRRQLASRHGDRDAGLRLQLTPAGRSLMRGFHRAVGCLADSGRRLVVDDMLFERWLLDDWSAVLQSHRVLLIGVRCSLDELERRERCRTDRDAGLARGHFESVHDNLGYDLDVHTDRADVDACARAILRHWQCGPSPQSLKQLAPAFR